MKEMIIVDLTYWKNHGLNKKSKTHSPTLLAQGGGYGICVIEIDDGEIHLKASAEELRNP